MDLYVEVKEPYVGNQLGDRTIVDAAIYDKPFTSEDEYQQPEVEESDHDSEEGEASDGPVLASRKRKRKSGKVCSPFCAVINWY